MTLFGPSAGRSWRSIKLLSKQSAKGQRSSATGRRLTAPQGKVRSRSHSLPGFSPRRFGSTSGTVNGSIVRSFRRSRRLSQRDNLEAIAVTSDRSTAPEIRSRPQASPASRAGFRMWVRQMRMEVKQRGVPLVVPSRDQRTLDQLTERLKGNRQRIEKLKSEAVNLTVAGTEMPSRLSYAPTLWLAALFGWLVFFGIFKLRAQKNLAAAVAAYGNKSIPFGLAQVSSIWLAPLPERECLRLPSGGSEAISREKMLGFLGWTEAEAHRTKRVAQLIWLGIFFLGGGRLVLIAAEVNSGFAVEEGLTGGVARIVNSICTAILGALCILALVRVASARASQEHEAIAPARRESLQFALGGVALFGLVWSKPGIQDRMASMLPDIGSQKGLAGAGAHAKVSDRPCEAEKTPRSSRRHSCWRGR